MGPVVPLLVFRDISDKSFAEVERLMIVTALDVFVLSVIECIIKQALIHYGPCVVVCLCPRCVYGREEFMIAIKL